MIYNQKYITFVQRHQTILVWLALYVIMLLMSMRHQPVLGAFIITFTTIIPMILLCSVMRAWTLPRMLHRHPWRFGVVNLIIMAALVWLSSVTDSAILYTLLHSDIDIELHPLVRQEIEMGSKGNFFLHTKYTFLLLSTATVTTVVYQLQEQTKLKQESHEQQVQNELKYLRQQINPHFLFNALNCIYALTMTQDKQAPDSVMKLSQMLRYVLTDCSAERVPLEKEVQYIRNYIDFYRIRMEHEPDLTIDVTIQNPDYPVPPMLMQPIVENCFKHSRIIDNPDAWIHIVIRQTEAGLLFTCDNSKPAEATHSSERTGIGLQNVQQRLNMLFGEGNSSLKIIEDNNHYKTVLHV